PDGAPGRARPGPFPLARLLRGPARVRLSAPPHPDASAPRTMKRLLPLLLSILPSLSGQGTTPPPATPPPAPAAVELSPFQVTTDRDVGYTAENSLAGSRLNTALRD
ncbi:MAG: hypothetical protein ACK55I_14855, partial [bacterium]